jgi:hypothetical protein
VWKSMYEKEGRELRVWFVEGWPFFGSVCEGV